MSVHCCARDLEKQTATAEVVLFWSAVINGVISVPITAAMMVVVSRRHEMGQFIGTPDQRILGWAVTVIMEVATTAMFVFQ